MRHMDSVNRQTLERVVNSWKSFKHNSVEIYGGRYKAMSGLNFMIDYGDGLLSGDIAIPEGLPPLFTVKQYFEAIGRSDRSLRVRVEQSLWVVAKLYDVPVIKKGGVNHYSFAMIPAIESRIRIYEEFVAEKQKGVDVCQ